MSTTNVTPSKMSHLFRKCLLCISYELTIGKHVLSEAAVYPFVGKICNKIRKCKTRISFLQSCIITLTEYRDAESNSFPTFTQRILQVLWQSMEASCLRWIRPMPQIQPSIKLMGSIKAFKLQYYIPDCLILCIALRP